MFSIPVVSIVFLPGSLVKEIIGWWIVYTLVIVPLVFVFYLFSVRCPRCQKFSILRYHFGRKGEFPLPIESWSSCFYCEHEDSEM